MTPRFGRPTAYVPPAAADAATPGAAEALDAFLALTPLDALAADAARRADARRHLEGDRLMGAPHQASPPPARTTASAAGPLSRPTTPASASDSASTARFTGAPHPAPTTTRVARRITHHLRRNA